MLNSGTSWLFRAPILVWVVVSSGVTTADRWLGLFKEQINRPEEGGSLKSDLHFFPKPLHNPAGGEVSVSARFNVVPQRRISPSSEAFREDDHTRHHTDPHHSLPRNPTNARPGSPPKPPITISQFHSNGSRLKLSFKRSHHAIPLVFLIFE